MSWTYFQPATIDPHVSLFRLTVQFSALSVTKMRIITSASVSLISLRCRRSPNNSFASIKWSSNPLGGRSCRLIVTHNCMPTQTLQACLQLCEMLYEFRPHLGKARKRASVSAMDLSMVRYETSDHTAENNTFDAIDAIRTCLGDNETSTPECVTADGQLHSPRSDQRRPISRLRPTAKLGSPMHHRRRSLLDVGKKSLRETVTVA